MTFFTEAAKYILFGRKTGQVLFENIILHKYIKIVLLLYVLNITHDGTNWLVM